MNISDQDKKRAEELAREYVKTLPGINYRSLYDFGIQNIKAYSEGYFQGLHDKNEEMEKEMPLFTNWCAQNEWCFYSGRNSWENKSRGILFLTTSELYQLYKQQKP